MKNRVVASRPVVVVRRGPSESGERFWRRLLPAWIISGIVHLLFLASFLLVNVSAAETPLDEGSPVLDIEPAEGPSLDLENFDRGQDARFPIEFDVPRIEVVSVPGRVNPHDQPDQARNALQNSSAFPGLGNGIGGGKQGMGIICGPGCGPVSDSGSVLRNSLGYRATRIQMVSRDGGNAASEAAVALGLKWLAEHQGRGGQWSLGKFCQHGQCDCGGAGRADNDIAATALALLPFLGAGQTHKTGVDKGNLYTKVVESGLRHLVLKQSREGEFHPNMYAQGLATIALCEAYALTSEQALRGPAQRALNYIIDAQSNEGGWRYTRRQAGYDGSICGWQLMALKSGQMAGLDVPTGTLKAASKWLDAAATPDGSGYGYTTPGNGPATSAAGLLCRQYLGWGPRHPALGAGVANLHKIGPQPHNMYFSYYATQVMHHMGGGAWEAWNPTMRDSLIAAQDQGVDKPHQRGSWYDPRDSISSGQGGRIMQTSLSLLTLEVYYRHMPLYRRDVGGDKALLDP